MAETLHMVRVTIPPFSIFVGHGHLQHAGEGWEGMSCLRYHAYFISSNISLKYAIPFAYGASFSIRPSTTETSDDEYMLETVDITEQ